MNKIIAKRSTIIAIQDILFKISDASQNIISSISDDQQTITSLNIYEETFIYIQLVTNNPQYNNYYIGLSNIKVYLDDSLVETEIFGLYEIVAKRIQMSDQKAFLAGQLRHRPFGDGITTTGINAGINIGQLIDKLSELCDEIPNTKGKKKKLVLEFTTKSINE